MIPDDELQRLLNSQPLARMRRFASLPGWNGLQLQHVRLSDDEAARANVPHGVVIFYMTTDLKFNLQINTCPQGQFRRHRATVKADRYGIVHTGWHDFELPEDDRLLQTEAERLKPWLDRSNFKNPKWRQQFCAEHPELCLDHSRNARRKKPGRK